jgi:hypothetical protein
MTLPEIECRLLEYRTSMCVQQYYDVVVSQTLFPARVVNDLNCQYLFCLKLCSQLRDKSIFDRICWC